MLTIFDYLLHFWLSFEIKILLKIMPAINDFTTFVFWNIEKQLKNLMAFVKLGVAVN